ncbi:MAG: hypothetical protein M3Z36_14585 [Acidobacteriota bacterium]|nr:hypothetical protein [Acidobacteriota bacterium]
MADFNTSQQRLRQARAARAAAEAEAAQAAERKKQLQAALDLVSRRANANDPAAAEKTRLEAGLARATETAGASKNAVKNANLAVDGALGEFSAFTDPRRNVSQLSDRSPFLLLPVRVETRFGHSGDQPQLWVRIYPDDCSIDTFEDTLSISELANAKLYWERIWAAGGVEADERGAWRGLVAAHGSGRAAWIVEHYEPVNIAGKPVKAAATDEILVIATQTALAAAEASATSKYWQALWLADGDLVKSEAARTALEAATSAARAKDLVANYQPFNLTDKAPAGKKKTDAALSTSFVVLPPDPAVKQSPWSQAPRVNHLADRFVVRGYNGTVQTLEAIGGVISLPLYVGPDPSADPAETIHPVKDDLFVPDELQWLVDFDRAVNAGMGIRIDLTPEQARTGFDRLLILGVQLSANESDATAAVEDLLAHHHYGRSGLSIVPQGTPTHNSTGTGTGYTQLDNADQSFDDRQKFPLFTPTTDPLSKLDGDWLTTLMGIDPALFAKVHGSDGKDHMQARAMQCALWPATLGYWMDKMLTPVFNDAAVDDTRWFFTNYVTGRGAIPALRIGGQPYGILPTTAFSRIAWLTPNRSQGFFNPRLFFLAKLAGFLMKIGSDWKGLSAQVSYVGKDGDPHQLLLDILGLHPASVEFHSRYAESINELFNIINLYGLGPDFWKALVALALDTQAVALLAKLGYSGGTMPDILQHFFMKDAAQMKNIIDDRPPSEDKQIRAYTDDGRNYVQWLIDAAKTSLDAVYREDGFTGNKTPETLFYLYLRHALTLGYYDSSYNLHRSAGFLSSVELQAMKPEPAFIHVADGAASESRFAALYKTEARITSSPSLLVSDFITKNIAVFAETRHLAEQLQCCEILKTASTAGLERAFAEHIDCCSYRHDAWLLGLVNYQLQEMRAEQGNTGANVRRGGVYLGAYAWLEDLRPSTARLEPVQLPPDIADNFKDTAPLLQDLQNGGYIHAPSLPHANTAAVLRSGYIANATRTNADTMSVNLSSDRVRLALSMLEGIRNGQSFGALLGYHFERGLHDGHNLVEVDRFIYPMRKAFPLSADAISTTKTDVGVPIEAIEARNVMDGMKLVKQIRSGGASTYPFGKAELPGANAVEAGAIDSEVGKLLDIYDSIADLALAEGVHQAVQGNFERIAGTLEAYTSGHFPPDPEVVQTPAAGIGLTQRVAIHFEAGLPAPAGATPRAMAEPALDAWLSGTLPPLADVACHVTWDDPVTSAKQRQTVTLADLKTRPIDLLRLLKPDDLQSMNELDDRVISFVAATRGPRPDATLRIEYMNAGGKPFSFFQTLPLLRSLKAIADRARPLRATDAMLHNDASPADDASLFADPARISKPKADLDTLHTDAGAFLSALGALTLDPVVNRAALVAGIDGFIDSAVALLERAARFAIPSSGWGFAYDWKRTAFTDLMTLVGDLVARWKRKLAGYDAKIAAYDALPASASDDVRFQALRSAEIDIATKLDPLPAAPAPMRAALNGKRAVFAARLAQFAALRNTASLSFASVLAAAQGIATADLDPQTLELKPFEDRAIVLAQDLVTNLTGHQTAIKGRSAAVQTQLDAGAAAASASAKVDAIQAAAKALLGPDFQIYPEFSITAQQGDEWANALADSASGALTKYLITTAKVDFPVDEWLYGIARVRPNMRSWEQMLTLTDAFGNPRPDLTPAQFPYEAGASWLALPYPPDTKLTSDRLLYTAQYPGAFNKAARQCGILLDEWTEAIPSTTRDTGIAFNFDRPNNEAPQSFLLVTPATANGAWQWEDLMGALNETLDLAKSRAVEPVHIDWTGYSPFLPATIMAATLYGISITTTLAATNGVYRSFGATTTPNA